MSANVQDSSHGAASQSPVKASMRGLRVVFFVLLIPVLVVVGLVTSVGSADKTGAGGVGSEQDVAMRIQKVGSVTLGQGTRTQKTGEEVFKAQCSACHATGAAGSPKFQDAAAWAPRIGAGYEALLNSALKGKNAMSPQGGGVFSDLEVGRAVVYMANAGGAKFEVPKAPADAASDPAAAASAPAAVPASAAR